MNINDKLNLLLVLVAIPFLLFTRATCASCMN